MLSVHSCIICCRKETISAHILQIKFEWNLCICRKENCHKIGYQPTDPHLRSQYKATLKDSGGSASQVHHKTYSARRTGGFSSNLLPETYDDVAAVGLPNNGSQYYPFFVCTSILLFYLCL
jgi:hypothetical protein